MQTKRIEFIDAMRGLTMLLVVYSHIVTFGYGIQYAENPYVFNRFLSQVRMPLFFFISGFIMYKPAVVWDVSKVWSFLRKKFMVQVVPTAVFLSVYAWIFLRSWDQPLWRSDKYGFWFTLTLFQYFLIYSVLRMVSHYLRLPAWLCGGLIGVVGLVLYVLAVPEVLIDLGMVTDWWRFVAPIRWCFFVYFLFGMCVKRYYGIFQRGLDNSYVMAAVLGVLFIGSVYYFHGGKFVEVYLNEFYELLIAATGVVVAFATFRKNSRLFSKQTVVGRTFQYIGTRTLDVYLLHYFFLPHGLREFGLYFNRHHMPVLEFSCSLLFASTVVAATLVVSHLLRLSPLLGHYLFGVKLPVAEETEKEAHSDAPPK